MSWNDNVIDLVQGFFDFLLIVRFVIRFKIIGVLISLFDGEMNTGHQSFLSENFVCCCGYKYIDHFQYKY